jgi:N6-L-threonylcarbamoyladenine synthase
MLVLGIETSCDETSAALVRDGRHVLSNVIASSKQAFAKLAGVIPEEAARQQVECMMPVVREALAAANITPAQIDAVAVTRGPGLLGSLLVGSVTARVLGACWDKPVIGVHHTLGHLSSPWLSPPGTPPRDCRFPLLTLSVSGGHTDIWLRESHLRGRILGRTRDDASGEAFDKGASVLGLPYPGGPSIAAEAVRGNPKRYPFPKPLAGNDSLDFSFSGLKTALKYLLRDDPDAARNIPDVAASFQHAICVHLADRLERALERHPEANEVHLVGGVSANTHLREIAGALCRERSIELRHPLALPYCTDNAAMIAAAGYFMQQEQPRSAARPFETKASIPLEETLVA